MSKISLKAEKYLAKYQEEVNKLSEVATIAGTYTVPNIEFKWPKDVRRHLDFKQRQREKQRDEEDYSY